MVISKLFSVAVHTSRVTKLHEGLVVFSLFFLNELWDISVAQLIF